ncbi:MAG TPA: crossover junction endodeoxyribonuclease RuvC [Candidatus Saccharimonadales bacterium]|nr:crossover junction endodeoxyribonuclease RuvC [Candidatus Saccharimonadales bacterium]
MRLLGIDPGTGILGFGVIDVAKNPQLVDAGVIRTPAHQPEPERLLTIYEGLQEIVATTNPQVVSVEKLFFARNVTTALAVSQARGVVLLIAQQHHLPVFEYTPMQIKMSLTGYGKADKKQVQEMVRILLSLTEIPKPDDCADALAAALTHAAISR